MRMLGQHLELALALQPELVVIVARAAPAATIPRAPPDPARPSPGLQGTAEGHAFRRDELDALLALAEQGIGQLLGAQRAALAR